MWTFVNAICISICFSVWSNCSVNSSQIIYISWHFDTGAAPGKSTSSCILACTANSGSTLQWADPRAAWKLGRLSTPCGAIETLASWNMTVGLRLFGTHLWHFLFHYSHIVRVIAREPPTIWCIITHKCCREAGKPVPGNHYFLLPLLGTVCLLLQNLSSSDCLEKSFDSVSQLCFIPWKIIYSAHVFF